MGQSSLSTHSIDGHSIAVLVVFLLVNLLVVFPLRIPLPRPLTHLGLSLLRKLRILASSSQDKTDSTAPKEKVSFELGMNSAPVLAALVLLASGSISGHTIRMGIVGEEVGVKPYDIMLLFISLAYLSISLDATGLLRYLAFLVSQKGGSSGPKLYLSFYAFFFATGALVGNDPVVLSGTGFLVYFTRVTGVDPKPWIFAQFAAANIASTILVSSNPTNLILTSSFGISFTTYSAWVILPSLAAAVAAFPVLLYWEHHTDVPEWLEGVDVEPGRALVDPWGAIIGSGLLAATLVVLVAGSAAGVLGGVWEVTVPAAILMLIRDVVHDLRENAQGRVVDRVGTATNSGVPGEVLRRKSATGHPAGGNEGMEIELNRVEGTKEKTEDVDTADAGRLSVRMEGSSISTGLEAVSGSSSRAALVSASSSTRPVLSNPRPSQAPSSAPLATPDPPSRRLPISLPSLLSSLATRFPTSTQTVRHLPFPLLPFAFAQFVLVDGLAAAGWSRVFAVWWGAWAERTGTAGIVFLLTSLSVVLCNIIGTNIGCCLLLTSILQTWSSTSSPPPSQRHLTAAIYSLALGSNLGAVSFTFPASLAGLLWRRILVQKGIRVGRGEFVRRNWKVLLAAVVLGASVLVGEVLVMVPVG